MGGQKKATDRVMPYGWCITGDHDTPKGRGGCPVQVGGLNPCTCECHGGASEARPLLGTAVKSQVEALLAEPDDEVADERTPVAVGSGEQIPLL